MRKGSARQARTEQGRQLARRLYEYKLVQLEQLGSEEETRPRSEFPTLSVAEFHDVLQQVIAAKRYEQERVGWQAIPHDVAVLALVIVTAVWHLRAGIVAGVAVLVLLESIFQFYFDRRIYRPLSTLVWLTYPAYAVLALVLHRRGMQLLWILVIVGLVWAGTFLLGALARLPVRLIRDARAKGIQEAARREEKKPRRRKD